MAIFMVLKSRYKVSNKISKWQSILENEEFPRDASWDGSKHLSKYAHDVQLSMLLVILNDKT